MIRNAFILLLLAGSISAYAGDNKRTQLFINAGTDYHFNKSDVINDIASGQPLTTNNTAGMRLGAEYCWKLPANLVFSTGIDFGRVPQTLTLKYNAAEMGFDGSDISYVSRMSFINYYLDPFARLGYSQPISRKSSIDFYLGVITSIPLNGEHVPEDDVIALNITDQDHTDLVMYIDTKWGNKSDNNAAPVNTLLSTTFAYRITLGRTTLRTGLHLITGTNKRLNRTTVNYFGPDRREIGNSIFFDRFQSLGLFIGIGL